MRKQNKQFDFVVTSWAPRKNQKEQARLYSRGRLKHSGRSVCKDLASRAGDRF